MLDDELEQHIVYTSLYSEMTEGTLSKLSAMHGGSFGRHVQYRNQLADKIASSITKQYKDPSSLTKGEIDQIVKALKVKLSEFSSREETAESFGWSELDEGHDLENKAIQKKFIDEVMDLSIPLYMSLYYEMTKGKFSKMHAMDGGMGGRHNYEYRNPLARKIALALTDHYSNPLGLTEDRISQIVKALGDRLSGFASREAAATAFGWQELDKGHAREDYIKQKRFVEYVVALSDPLSYAFYNEMTQGKNTGVGDAMHGGSRVVKAGFVGVFFLPVAGLDWNKGDRSERNALAINISISVLENVRRKQLEDSKEQIEEGLYVANMLLAGFTSRDTFVKYYVSNRTQFIGVVSEAVLENAKLKSTTMYKALYDEMTEGALSKTKAMHGGAMGRHVEYRNQLAENLALKITKYYDNPEALKVEEVSKVVKALGDRLSDFTSREETASAFGWQEKWSGGHVIGNEDKQKEFIKSVVTHNRLHDLEALQDNQSQELVMDQDVVQEVTGGLPSGGAN